MTRASERSQQRYNLKYDEYLKSIKKTALFAYERAVLNRGVIMLFYQPLTDSVKLS